MDNEGIPPWRGSDLTLERHSLRQPHDPPDTTVHSTFAIVAAVQRRIGSLCYSCLPRFASRSVSSAPPFMNCYDRFACVRRDHRPVSLNDHFYFCCSGASSSRRADRRMP
jgi:hypothetical protein